LEGISMSARRVWFALCVMLLTAPLHAQSPAPPPAANEPRHRLALVVGMGKLGERVVLDSAHRDSEAVARALRAGGFEVLLRADPSAAELRSALEQFRNQLKASSVGLIYYAGLAAQVDGRNLLITSDVALADNSSASAVAALLRAAGLPLQEAADSLAGGADAARALIVDAAYRHPALARLSPPGLARLRLAPGSMGLLGHAPAALQDVLSAEGPSRFAAVMVEALTTPRISLPEALRAVRLSVQDSSGGRIQPWLGGETFGRVLLADAQRLESPPAPQAAASAASAPDKRSQTDGRTARAPGRGERPVFQARSNNFGHAEGDTLSYQLTDTRKDELLLSYTLAIDKVLDNGALQANNGAWLLDAQGRVQQQRSDDGSQSRFEPAQEWWWQRPQAGESRALVFKESYVLADKSRGVVEWRGSAQVGTARLLETQAGEFEVLPIKSSGSFTRTPDNDTPQQGLFTRTVWFAPKLALPVAIDIEDNDSQGRALRRERIELTHAQQLRGAN
jgi:Caspase domain